MDTKIKELLAVLDLPEEEQIQFLVDYLESSTDQSYLPDQLADLAFRLRDEVIKLENGSKFLLEAIVEIIGHKEGRAICPTCGHEQATRGFWEWRDKAQPIDHIVAALRAKEMASAG